MPAAMAEAFAAKLEREALETALINYQVYLSALGERRPSSAEQVEQFRQALEFCFRLSTIDNSFDVPFVAGYAKNDGHYIFIDRYIPAEGKSRGVFMPVFKFLNVHELVEKALLDEYELTYMSAHQVAQRAERAVAASIGVRWEIYDEFIDQAAGEMEKHRMSRISDRLDLQPYLSYDDSESIDLVKEMKAKTVEHDRVSVPYSVKQR
jgi:hypothetical protein